MRGVEVEPQQQVIVAHDQERRDRRKQIVRELFGPAEGSPASWIDHDFKSWVGEISEQVRQHHEQYGHYSPPEFLTKNDWRAVALLCAYMYPANFPKLRERDVHWLQEREYLAGRMVNQQDKLLPYILAYHNYLDGNNF